MRFHTSTPARSATTAVPPARTRGAFGELAARYALELDVESVPGLCRRFELTHPLA